MATARTAQTSKNNRRSTGTSKSKEIKRFMSTRGWTIFASSFHFKVVSLDKLNPAPVIDPIALTTLNTKITRKEPNQICLQQKKEIKWPIKNSWQFALRKMNSKQISTRRSTSFAMTCATKVVKQFPRPSPELRPVKKRSSAKWVSKIYITILVWRIEKPHFCKLDQKPTYQSTKIWQIRTTNFTTHW